MVTLHPASLRQEASRLLPDNAKRIVLLHTAVPTGIILLVTALNYFLQLQIANTGGISGLGPRAALSTIQSVLDLAVNTGLPFWEVGLLSAALLWARGEAPTAGTLLQGFRRFPSVLGLQLLLGMIALAVGMVVLNFSSAIFFLTPFSDALMEELSPIFQPDITPQELEAFLTPERIAQITQLSVPILILFGTVFLLLFIAVFYRLRFAKLSVMDGNSTLSSIAHSAKLTHRNCLQLLKLDLSFWWYYLLEFLCVALCYGGILLPLLGISLPLSRNAAFLLFYAVGLIFQGLIQWAYRGKLMTVYALAYRQLEKKPSPPAKEPENPVPWEM